MDSSSSRAEADQLLSRTAAEMSTNATAGCFIVLLAVVLTVVWRRRQRWRRTRPWLAKLRAEAASKIEKERSDVHKETNELKETPKEIPKDKTSEKERRGKERIVPAETKSDGSVGKRAKERRRRGREPKSTRMTSTALINDSQTQLPADQLNVTQPSHNTFPSPSPSAHLIPLPPSPALPALDQAMPPAVVLSPTSPMSTSFSTFTEVTATTPTTSTSTSPAPTSPAFPINTNTNTKGAGAKLPAFPPASPLPPNLARKPPPLVRKSTPSLTSINTGSLSRKPSFNVERRPSKETEAESSTLNPWPTMAKEEPLGRPKANRKPSDAGRKDQSGRGRKPSDAKKVNGGSAPESTQIASLRGALEAARLREEEVAEERRAWQKKERELQTQVNQLSHQLHALTVAFATGGGQGFPPYGYGYGMSYDPSQPSTPISKSEPLSSEQAPTLDQSHTPTDPMASIVPPSPAGAARTPGPTYQAPYPYYPYVQYPPFMPPSQLHPHPQMIPTATPIMSPPVHGSMSPPHASPHLFSAHPWTAMHRGGSPMRSPIHSMPGVMHPIPGRHPHSGFYTGSPRRGGSRQRRQGTGTPSTPSVGSVDDSLPLPTPDVTLPCTATDTWVPPRDDYVPLREDYVPIPPPPSGVKREREPETDEAYSSSEDESDEDSVIFEDGSVGDSVNLSLRGGDNLRGKDSDLEVSAMVRIRVGEEVM